MLVDDSAVVRGLISRIVDSDKRLSVKNSVGDGLAALRILERNPVDVILLDIEMPRMDGLEALPKLLELQPQVQVIMVSTLTTRNAEITFKALGMGAADTIAKPTASAEIYQSGGFKDELIGKILALGEVARRPARPARAPTPAPTSTAQPATTVKPRPARVVQSTSNYSLRPTGRFVPQVLAIGSSTGGPQALFTLMKGLGPDWKLPTVITQHMPPKFTSILANHIQEEAGRPCIEAKGGEALEQGCSYVAPGGYHMLIERKAGRAVIVRSNAEPENFCKPAVDPMFRSLVSVYGPKVLAVILTGMGQDGANGCEEVVKGGGTVFSQDESTSVVWGMPAAVANRGLSSDILPIDELANRIRAFVLGRAK
jgi:two-component system chemotaxis response regulator CheB